MINLKNIHKQFDTKKVLENINWEIPKASIYGLVGPNGAGKSTLLRIISGVLKADEGTVLVNGVDVYDNPSIKKHILFVSDDPFFLPQSTIKEMRHFYELFYPSFNDSMYHSLLKKFGLNEIDRITDFSKGMKRQASIILALSCSPDVLLLDEAFDGLDPVMRLNLKRIIANELMNRDMTVIISSHNLRELEDICDRIALLNNHTITIQDEIESIRNQYHKIQLAYTNAIDDKVLHDLNPMFFDKRGNVYMIVLKGDLDDKMKQIKDTQPVLCEEIPITMEEVFVYEMEANGYGSSI
jgi:ABC-2 type transport system ATP-binding protein